MLRSALKDRTLPIYSVTLLRTSKFSAGIFSVIVIFVLSVRLYTESTKMMALVSRRNNFRKASGYGIFCHVTIYMPKTALKSDTIIHKHLVILHVSVFSAIFRGCSTKKIQYLPHISEIVITH
jgi:hypothetical protein